MIDRDTKAPRIAKSKAARAGGGIVHAVEGWEETWKILKKQ